MGQLLGARVLAEFGDAPGRYVDTRARKNYAGTSPITRQSGKRRVALAGFVRNDRLIDALLSQAQSALQASPGAHAYYHKQRARGVDHHAALRQLANRLVGILHGCLKTGTVYDETAAWPHQSHDQQLNYPGFSSDLYRRIRKMPRQYSPEFRQRALRLLETTREASDISEFEAIKSVASKLGISEESLRRWRRKAQIDAGERPGMTAASMLRSSV
jgi:uncharacterized protein (DUF2384 family)